MRLRPPDLEIPADNPFAKDALDRSTLEPTLTEFVTQAIGPFTLAVDGGWGTGKTTFLKMWQPKLEARGHLCLYFNAWETDFATDPLIALVGELSEAIEQRFSAEGKENKAAKLLKKSKILAGSVARRAVPALVKAATAGMLDLGDVAEDALGSAAAELAEEQIKSYELGKSEIREFKATLAKLVERVLESRGEDAKVVLIVDELDRCRPTYAIELLERIKHLFDTPRVAFVLGIDRLQLAHSVKAVYGRDFDAGGYLRRFIDFDYQLPLPERGKFVAHLLKVFQIEDLVRARKVEAPRDQLRGIYQALVTLFEGTQISLRSQSQLVARLRVSLQTIPRDNYLFGEQLVLLLFLREYEQQLFQWVLERDPQADSVMTWLEGVVRRADGPLGQRVTSWRLSHSRVSQNLGRGAKDLTATARNSRGSRKR